MPAVPSAMATAAAVTPVVSVIPLPTIQTLFSPPTVIESVAGVGSVWGRWGNIQRGVSVLKFGTRYVQYRMPTEDDIASADLAYIGGHVYEVDDTEAAGLTEAGYGPCLSLLSVPYVDRPGDFGGPTVLPPLPGLFMFPPVPAMATAVAVPPYIHPEPIVARAAVVSAVPAVAYAYAQAPQGVSGGTTVAASVSVPPASASASAVAPGVSSGASRNVTAVPATATAAAVAPAVSGTGSGGYPATYPATYGADGGVVPYGTSPASLANWKLAFSDEFAGTSVNTSVWSMHDGWTNQNNVTTLASNASVSGGILTLQLSDATHGAEMSTEGSSGYGLPVGGYTEARCYFPGDGTNIYNWPAWWTSGPSWPSNGEIDIAEVLGQKVTANYHYGPTSGPYQQDGPYTPSGYWGDAWHVFGAYRTSSNVYIYWDGNLVATMPASDSGARQPLLLNIGVSGTAHTGPTGAFQVDYVRAWEPA